MSQQAGSQKSFRFSFSRPLLDAFHGALRDWSAQNKVARLWNKDSSLWTGDDERKWMGWLSIVSEQLVEVTPLIRMRDDALQFEQCLLLGMGGSSLCPEVLSMTFGRQPGRPELLVLDSTDPAQIRSFDSRVDPRKTLFVVASKSGSTLEPNIFKQYFFERTRQAVGEKAAPRHFIAITDPGSKLEKEAHAENFRAVFAGEPSIGGRYSALSNFGMVPAAIMGLDVKLFLQRAEEMVDACSPRVPPDKNPGVSLGCILGALGKAGHDKITILTSPGISDLGAWLEQLLAESTGKQGKGLVPVDREDVGSPEVYGDDRLFIYLRVRGDADEQQESAVAELERAGQPVVRIELADKYELGAEFFRWEVATAVAGSILGINPFNQPDVEASKVATRQLTTEFEKFGAFPPQDPILAEDGVEIYADARNAEAVLGNGKSLGQVMVAHLDRISPGDYFALLAYIAMTPEHEEKLQRIRHSVRDGVHVATCLGFGPRFLHSTGQAYKGGPNSGVFLQITADDAVDLQVPEQKYSFGIVKAAQARGDFEVLSQRGRRALRVHFKKGVDAGLEKLAEAVRQAVS